MASPFALADIAPQPWRNGGGRTREILCSPTANGADSKDWDWRVSVADIDRPGAFSVFPGVDRTALLLAGAGLTLCGETSRSPLIFGATGDMYRFAGETGLDADPAGGPARLLNVMTRRGHASAVLTRHGRDGELDLRAAATVLFVTGGSFTVTVHGPGHPSTGYRLAAACGLCLTGDPRLVSGHIRRQASQTGAGLIQISFHNY